MRLQDSKKHGAGFLNNGVKTMEGDDIIQHAIFNLGNYIRGKSDER